MGNGSSSGQGRNTTYGSRDLRKYSAETSYWPELAGAKLAESSGTGPKPYSDAVNVGLRSSKSTEHGVHVVDDNARFVPGV